MKLRKVQTGVLWATIAGFVVMLLCLGVYYLYQSSVLRGQAAAAKGERKGFVGKVLSAGTKTVLEPIRDNSAWDDLYIAVQKNDTATIEKCVGYMPYTYDAGSVVVFDTLGNKIYDKNTRHFPDNIYPFSWKDLEQFYSDPGHYTFTLNIDGRLFNYVGAGIVPTADEYTRTTTPVGYIMLVREITQNDIRSHCKTLGNIDAALFTDEAEKNAYINSLVDTDYIESRMKTFRGDPSAYVCFTYPDPAAGQLGQFTRVLNMVSVGLILIFVLVLWYVNRRITLPLRKISKSFQKDHIAPVLPLTKERNEFGQISSMMMEFFEQKEEIAQQNERMKELNDSLTAANQHLTDSITYASRLQKSMLLAHAPKEGWFSDSFTIYKPKDIVGGDFYVCETIGGYNIAVVGDCTGHGVPGAILASMGISFLYEVIDASDFDFMPDTLLNRLRTKVIAAFGVDEKTGKHIDDGMDVAVVIYNTNTSEAYFAGAGRPAAIVHDGSLQVAKGDRMPIGRYIKDDNFTRKKIDLHSGDIVYLYSDGCTDQMGGDQMRKLTDKLFQQHLLEISTLDFPAQKADLEHFLDDWRGEIPQTDDVTLLAFRV